MSGDKVIEGNIWVRANGDSAEVGFVPEFLKMFQEEGWNVIPNTGSIKKGQPLMAVETNDSLLSIISPVDGEVQEVAFHAQNSPEKLTTDCRVLTIFTGKKVVKKKPTTASVSGFIFDEFAPAQAQPQMGWVDLELGARRPAPAPVGRPRIAAGQLLTANTLRNLQNVIATQQRGGGVAEQWALDMLASHNRAVAQQEGEE